MISLRSAICVALFWSSFATSASACTLARGTILPTNFELVQLADAIVIAKVISGFHATQWDTPLDKSVYVQIESKLKGDAPAEIELKGFVIGSPPPSDPDELARANPEAYHGACSRYTFALNDSYVLFLRKDASGRWGTLDYAFSRTSEDYFGPNSLWVRAIETYADVQARFTSAEQVDELARIVAAKLASPPSAAGDEEIADINSYLMRVGQVR